MTSLAVVGLLMGAVSQRARANPSFQQAGNTLVMSNGNVRLEYNLQTGATDFYWNNSLKIANFH